MKVFTAPQVPKDYQENTIFLAGSIEQNKADRWQDKVIKAIKRLPGTVYNPRREAWDETWKEGSPELIEQIQWEIRHLDDSDTIFFYFQGDTLSPISLLELGLALGWSALADEEWPTTVIVVCEPNFWRRTNVEVTCAVAHHVKVYDTLDEGIEALKAHIKAG